MRRREPTFMNFTEHKVGAKSFDLKMKKAKKKRNVVKKIESELTNLTANFGAMSKQLAEVTTQIRGIRRLLE